MGLLLCSPAGNDILFDETQIEQGRNFCNKIWNAFRLIQGWETADSAPTNASNQAKYYLENRLNAVLIENEKLFSEFRLSDALMATYKLIWDDFCAIYLEAIKPPYGEPIAKATQIEAQGILLQLMSLLHPYMPFISEEIASLVSAEGQFESLVTSAYPQPSTANENQLAPEPMLLVSEIRNLRNTKGLSPKETLELWVPETATSLRNMKDFIEKLANVNLSFNSSSKPVNGLPLIIGVYEIWVELEIEVDPKKEMEDLMKEMEYYEGFVKSVMGKLGNERFVQNAKPEVVEIERKKLADANEKLTLIQNRMNQIGG
jgi:valyl-tRNA synthetase